MDPDRARQLLNAERARIVRSLAQLRHADTAEPNDYVDSPVNLASEPYQEELDEGLADDLHRPLAAVERAEQRLAPGTYWFSIESGRLIPDERLEAIPTAERTAEEEATREQRTKEDAMSFLSRGFRGRRAAGVDPARIPPGQFVTSRSICGADAAHTARAMGLLDRGRSR
jgi:DnaK suppressor protein